MKNCSKLLLIFLCSSFISLNSFSEEVVIWNRTADSEHHSELIKMILEVTKEKYGDYSLIPSKDMEQDEVQQALLLKNTVDVAVISPDAWNEKNLLPIYTPISRGLLGMRLCLMNEKFKESLKDVETLEDLKKKNLTFLTARVWPDTEIMKKQGLRVETSKEYKDLFSKLNSKKAKCFSRSLNEIEEEVENIENLSLTVDEYVLILYELPSLIFVTPTNPKLRERLKIGLEKLKESEEFLKIFWKHFKDVFSQYNIAKRSVIILPNHKQSAKVEKMIEKQGTWIPEPMIEKEIEERKEKKDEKKK